MITKNYVAGFLFNYLKTSVLLIKKNRPEWQEGLLNGIGGKIEKGESPLEAMTREFREETGANITNWDCFSVLTHEDVKIYFFYSIYPKPKTLVEGIRQQTDEELHMVDPNNLDRNLIVPNLIWLVPMALYMSEQRCNQYHIEEQGIRPLDRFMEVAR